MGVSIVADRQEVVEQPNEAGLYVCWGLGLWFVVWGLNIGVSVRVRTSVRVRAHVCVCVRALVHAYIADTKTRGPGKGRRSYRARRSCEAIASLSV